MQKKEEILETKNTNECRIKKIKKTVQNYKKIRKQKYTKKLCKNSKWHVIHITIPWGFTNCGFQHTGSATPLSAM